MTSSIANITFDAPDALALAQFWREVLGWNIGAESSEAEASLRAPDGGISLYFMQVPEDKQGKNRVHLDVTPDGDPAQEVHRLTQLGATLVSQQPG